jgi:hypothetical protein
MEIYIVYVLVQIPYLSLIFSSAFVYALVLIYILELPSFNYSIMYCRRPG